MPPVPPPHGEFSDSDQLWFDRLRGRPGAGGDPRAAQEGDALRQALDDEHQRLVREAEAEAETPVDDAADAREWQRLQAALRQEGLLPAARRPRWTWPALGGLAAAVLLSAVLVPLWTGPDPALYPEPPVLRGGLPVREVESATPRDAAERFAEALRRAGTAPALFQQAEAFIVDVVIAPDALEAVRPAFAAIGLAPVAGLNRVVFAAR